MPLVVAGRQLGKISVVDDDESVRTAYGYPLEELSLMALSEQGPLRALDEVATDIKSKADAAICDHHLKVSNYASFNGADLVAKLYRLGFPALLCTRWERARIDEIRRLRRYIPVLVRPDELNPDTFLTGIEGCMKELGGELPSSRKPWRALVRIADVDSERGFFEVVVPGWNSKEVVRLMLDDVPLPVRNSVRIGARLHACVNLGAETQDELYFFSWESF